jgi:hypothetical protein
VTFTGRELGDAALGGGERVDAAVARAGDASGVARGREVGEWVVGERCAGESRRRASPRPWR